MVAVVALPIHKNALKAFWTFTHHYYYYYDNH